MERVNYLDIITLEDLQEQHKIYANLIGLENVIKLSYKFGGTQIYIPKPDELAKELKYKKIREEYNGANIRELAIKYDVSESTVYRTVRDRIEAIKAKPFDGQITLFNMKTDCQ